VYPDIPSGESLVLPLMETTLGFRVAGVLRDLIPECTYPEFGRKIELRDVDDFEEMILSAIILTGDGFHVSFDEEGEKGFVLIDTEGEHITHRFVPFAERTLHRIEVDITGSLRNIEIEDRIRAALAGIPAKDLVRVELVGALELESMVDTDAIYSPFKDKYYHFEIKDRTNIRILPDSYKLDKSLRGEFIRLVSEAEGLSDEDRAFVATLGIAALMGEPLRLEEVDK